MGPYVNIGTARLYPGVFRPLVAGIRLVLCLLPSAISSSGGVYSGWTDVSGYNRSPAVTGSPAVDTSGFAPCVVFDGANDRLDGDLSIPAGTDYTLFFIRQNDDTAGSTRKWFWDTSSTGAAAETSSVLDLFGSIAARQEEVGDPATASAFTSTDLEVVRVDFTARNRVIFVNGVWKGSNAVPASTQPITKYRLGNRFDGLFPWAGKLYAVLVFTGPMPDKEKQRIENELMDLAGIARPFAWPLDSVTGSDNPRFVLPPVMHAIVGRPLRIHEDSVHYWPGRNPALQMTCALPRERAPMGCWQFTPSAAGDYNLTVTAGSYSQSTIIRAIPMLAPGATKKYILCVGDSRTHRGAEGWVEYLLRMLGSSRADFVGPLGPSNGYGGRYYGVDSTRWSDGTAPSSVFVNDGVLDMPNFISTLAHVPNMVIWSWGQNTVTDQNDMTVDGAITADFVHAEALIAAMAAAVPGVQQFLTYGWPLAMNPALFDGTMSTRLAKRRTVHRYVERLVSQFSGREVQGLHLIPRTWFEVDTVRGATGDAYHENTGNGHEDLAEATLPPLVAQWGS